MVYFVVWMHSRFNCLIWSHFLAAKKRRKNICEQNACSEFKCHSASEIHHYFQIKIFPSFIFSSFSGLKNRFKLDSISRLSRIMKVCCFVIMAYRKTIVFLLLKWYSWYQCWWNSIETWIINKYMTKETDYCSFNMFLLLLSCAVYIHLKNKL